MEILTILLCDITSLWLGIAASVIGSVIVVFLLFWILRPNIKIEGTIAKDNGEFLFCFKNKSLFPCVNIKPILKAVKVSQNADEEERKIETTGEYIARMSGCLSSKKDNECAIIMKGTLEPDEKRLRLIVSSQHSVSGITSVTIQDYRIGNAENGNFEKGLFIPEGSNYAAVYLRRHINAIKTVTWIMAILIAISTIVYGIFFAENWMQTTLCFLGLCGFVSIVLILWLCNVLARAEAFSTRTQMNSLNLMMVKLGVGKESPRQDPEDAQAIEIKDDNNI